LSFTEASISEEPSAVVPHAEEDLVKRESKSQKKKDLSAFELIIFLKKKDF
jgi:hypothetical protein